MRATALALLFVGCASAASPAELGPEFPTELSPTLVRQCVAEGSLRRLECLLVDNGLQCRLLACDSHEDGLRQATFDYHCQGFP